MQTVEKRKINAQHTFPNMGTSTLPQLSAAQWTKPEKKSAASIPSTGGGGEREGGRKERERERERESQIILHHT